MLQPCNPELRPAFGLYITQNSTARIPGVYKLDSRLSFWVYNPDLSLLLAETRWALEQQAHNAQLACHCSLAASACLEMNFCRRHFVCDSTEDALFVIAPSFP